jgi:hypothetical protein
MRWRPVPNAPTCRWKRWRRLRQQNLLQSLLFAGSPYWLRLGKPLEEQTLRGRDLSNGMSRDMTSPLLPNFPMTGRSWHHLIEQDPDLAQLAAVLADYGQPYVDELAARYLMDPDKSRLSGIVDGIIAKAGRDVPVPPAGKLPAASKPWIVPVQVPEVASPRDVQAPSAFSAPAEALQLTETPIIAATAAVLDQPAPVDPLGSNGESGHTAITAADDDLTEMIRQFGPAPDFPHKA